MSEGYFSRVRVDPSAHATEWYRQALRRGEDYRDHVAAWRLFPGTEASRDFLYRRFTDGPGGGLAYYIVSRRKPVANDEFTVETKEYRPRLASGDMIAFSLRANPTVSRGEHGVRGTRHDVLMNARRSGDRVDPRATMDAAAIKWLLDRGPRIGLAIDEAQVMPDAYRQHRVLRNGRDAMRFSSLDYTGIATVADPDALVAVLHSGVGHSKAFGCGLLMVRRIS